LLWFDGSGQAKTVGYDQVVEAFSSALKHRAPSQPLDFVFLNGCKTLELGRLLIGCGVPYVLCWETSVSGGACHTLAKRFYRALREQYLFCEAFREACCLWISDGFDVGDPESSDHGRGVPMILWNDLKGVNASWTKESGVSGNISAVEISQSGWSRLRGWAPNSEIGKSELKLLSLTGFNTTVPGGEDFSVQNGTLNHGYRLTKKGLEVLDSGLKSYFDLWGDNGAVVQKAKLLSGPHRMNTLAEATKLLARIIEMRVKDIHDHASRTISATGRINLLNSKEKSARNHMELVVQMRETMSSLESIFAVTTSSPTTPEPLSQDCV